MPRAGISRWIWPALLVLAADQTTKLTVERFLPLNGIRVVIPNVFNLVNTTNPGVAFGLLANARVPWVGHALAFFSVFVMVFLAWMLLARRAGGVLSEWGMSLILGGAAGNVLDRLIHGSVTDFLDFYWRTYHWPAFNVADSAIVIGASLVLIELFHQRPQPAEESV
jgi:signal peptidase II